jgi:hypothetical protein
MIGKSVTEHSTLGEEISRAKRTCLEKDNDDESERCSQEIDRHMFSKHRRKQMPWSTDWLLFDRNIELTSVAQSIQIGTMNW